jgi:ketosteroid isomerase-like protein
MTREYLTQHDLPEKTGLSCFWIWDLSRVISMDVATARQWVEHLRRAWREGDPDAAADLFTVDAIYRSDPFRPALFGRAEIVRYWASATSNQSEIEVTFGEPLVDGDRVAVEWWSHTNPGGHPTTDAGGLFLTFESGLCSELREYWNLTDAAVAVPEGWGR